MRLYHKLVLHIYIFTLHGSIFNNISLIVTEVTLILLLFFLKL